MLIKDKQQGRKVVGIVEARDKVALIFTLERVVKSIIMGVLYVTLIYFYGVHLSTIGCDCFRSDHLAIADGVPESRCRDPTPGLRCYTPVRTFSIDCLRTLVSFKVPIPPGKLETKCSP
ncbi:hypothetical protein M0804_014106 [Polistes exclamans]|nr:hypothetical protein M0804_014107 [Polistes exclamans]KAI4475761.1 hypothetical protein M0804_014106 [Polistes exclamans]